MSRQAIFAYLFPGSAMVNALLATSYISIIPNLLLYFVPPNIKPTTLNTLAHFAIGSLLGDVFIHLLPHAFSSHTHDDSIEHNEQRNILVGISLFTGLFLFYASDKLVRAHVCEGHGHQHSDVKEIKENKKGLVVKVQASTYLNLLADFTHNLTDGMAMAASFYASPVVGATTTVAVFFHEIPHEISDYAILLKSGFSKRHAMLAQFTTAIGAYLGTLIGIFIEEMALSLQASEKSHHHHHHHHGLLGTGLTWSDLTLPLTAGGFIYIATVGVMPELLQDKTNKAKHQSWKELLAMTFGIGLMAFIALKEPHHH
ncbi:ZIP zinc transporter-domain-containing protein [Sporodiniella umbellata]|nr:ZIP zinc transporter-domain-containing protein [Sporodiniella umbellata]